MTSSNQSDWIVVVNSEKQYSIWPSNKSLPNGWQSVQIAADWLQEHKDNHPQHCAKKICLAYIGEIWQDLTPLSVRQHLMQVGAGRSTANS